MNKSTRKDERLLAETFHENWESGATAQFARAAAAHARHRRRTRQVLASAGTVATLALAIFVTRERVRPPAVALAVPAAATTAAQRGYEIISDDELLAQLRDLPVLAVQKANGTREVVVLEPEPKFETLE
jgi:hypothetical protein